MPIYEFKCLKCSKLHEISRTIQSRDDSISCQECNAEMERIYSGFSLTGKSDSYNFPENPNSQKGTPPANQSGRTHLRIEGKNHTVENNSFENGDIGISMPKGTKINISDPKFKNVSTPIQVTNK